MDFPAYLLQVCQIGNAFVDTEVAWVAEGSLRPASRVFFEVLFQILGGHPKPAIVQRQLFLTYFEGIRSAFRRKSDRDSGLKLNTFRVRARNCVRHEPGTKTVANLAGHHTVRDPLKQREDPLPLVHELVEIRSTPPCQHN